MVWRRFPDPFSNEEEDAEADIGDITSPIDAAHGSVLNPLASPTSPLLIATAGDVDDSSDLVAAPARVQALFNPGCDSPERLPAKVVDDGGGDQAYIVYNSDENGRLCGACHIPPCDWCAAARLNAAAPPPAAA